jgi:undecaprenyl-diphosphatase
MAQWPHAPSRRLPLTRLVKAAAMEPPAAVDSFFLAVTWLGSLHLLLPAALAVAALPVAGSHRFEALLPGVSLGLSALLTHALKLLVRRPRPQVDQLLVTLPADWSFPSAHTAQAAAFFLTLAFLARRRRPPRPAAAAVAGALLLVPLVGWSRVHLQVHFLSDVLAGGLLGALIAATVLRAGRRLATTP